MYVLNILKRVQFFFTPKLVYVIKFQIHLKVNAKKQNNYFFIFKILQNYNKSSNLATVYQSNCDTNCKCVDYLLQILKHNCIFIFRSSLRYLKIQVRMVDNTAVQ